MSSEAEALVAAVGGVRNIVHVTHCMSRLRFTLRDETLVDDDLVMSLPAVSLILRQSGQYQVGLSRGLLAAYSEVMRLVGA